MSSRRSDKVALAYVHGHDVTHSFHHSLMALVAHDLTTHRRVVEGDWLATRYGTGGIVKARNNTARKFLHDGDSDWLMWIDTDMGFEADSIDRLLDAADPETAPIVGGLCFTMREVGADGSGGMLVQPVPTIYRWTSTTSEDGSERAGYSPCLDYPRDAFMRCDATGSAFVLIHRSALAAIEAEFGDWYTPVWNPSVSEFVSEDLAFCMRANALELPIHVHSGIKTTHMKSVWVDERFSDRLDRIRVA